MRGPDIVAENVFFATHKAAERRDMEEKVDVWGVFQTSSFTVIAPRGQLLVPRKPSFPKSSKTFEVLLADEDKFGKFGRRHH